MCSPISMWNEPAVKKVIDRSTMACPAATWPSTITDSTRLMPTAMILNSFGASETGHQGTAFPTGDARLVRYRELAEATRSALRTALGDRDERFRSAASEALVSSAPFSPKFRQKLRSYCRSWRSFP